MKDTALVILGHGSSKHANSSIPCRLHADTIRRMDIFHSIHCGFLKETPFIEECLNYVDAEKVIIMPNFLAEGYYTKKIIPEKLGLSEKNKGQYNNTCCVVLSIFYRGLKVKPLLGSKVAI